MPRGRPHSRHFALTPSPERRGKADHRHPTADGFAALAPTQRLHRGGASLRPSALRRSQAGVRGRSPRPFAAPRVRQAGRRTRPPARSAYTGQHGCRRRGGTETGLLLATLRAHPLAREEGQGRSQASHGRWFCRPAVRQAIQSAALAPTERLQNREQGPQRTGGTLEERFGRPLELNDSAAGKRRPLQIWKCPSPFIHLGEMDFVVQEMGKLQGRRRARNSRRRFPFYRCGPPGISRNSPGASVRV